MRTSAALDYETKARYEVTVKADDGEGGTDTIDVTVNVTDVDEPPGAPGAPTVSPVEGSPTSLSVSWSAPANTGPPVTGYTLRHRVRGMGTWIETTPAGTGTMATIGGLAADTEYEVQVLARNAEGDSDWSTPGGGFTGGGRTVSMADVTVYEGSTAPFTIVFSPAKPGDRLIWYTHGNGRAREGEDFELTSKGIVLEADAEEVQGAVEIYADDEVEDEERFQIVITYGREGDTVETVGNIYIRDGESNGAPVFADGERTTRNVAENTAAGRPVGKPVSAEDPNDDPVTYKLQGPDATSFRIDTGTGQLRTRAALDHESKATYEVTVRATDDRGGTGRIAVTVNVEDVREKPGTPGKPSVGGSGRSLSVGWSAPQNTGPPMRYDLRYRETGGGWRTDAPRNVAMQTATLDGLDPDTEYEVQVLARSDEGTSDWSASGSGRTGDNGAPVFAERPRTTRSVAENTASGRPVGRAVSANDPDGDELTYTLEGPDAGSFGIDSGTGRLSTRAALDREAKASHTLTVKADDGEGGTETIEVTVNVTDVDEPPQAPGAPSVEGSGTSLSVRWSAPENTGPPMTYDLQYRETGESWTGGPKNVAGRSASIDGLAADTEYEVQVLAHNAEGASGWSASGRGRTDGGGRSLYMADVTVHEGQTAHFTIVFSAAKSDDDHLSWYTHGNGRARDGTDFQSTSRIIRLEAGATEVDGAVEILIDDEAEDEERFQIVISYGDANDTVEYVGSIYIRDGPDPASASPLARVAGDLLTLRYPGPLDAGSTPSGGDFVVVAGPPGGEASIPVTSVSVHAEAVLLRLARPVAADDIVTLTYLTAAMHPIRDEKGLAAPLAHEPVRNETGMSGLLALAGPAGGTAIRAPLAAIAQAAQAGAGTARLDLSSRGLTDVSALAGLSGVRELDLADNAIADLSPLAGLTGLQVLDLSGNRIADIATLAGLTELKRLNLSDNRIEALSALAGLSGLKVLDLSGNRIGAVSPLAGLTGLERLNLSGNRIGELWPLAGLGGLQVLLLDGNGVADVLGLSPLAGLENLGLSGNRIADIGLLGQLGGLRRLDLSGNAVADISALGEVSGLLWLRLPGNPVSDVTPLGRLQQLRWLWLDPATGMETLAPLTGGAPDRLWIERAPVQ